MNRSKNLRIKAFLSAFILVGALAYASPTQVMRVKLADGTTKRLLVEQISKITFKADKNDSAGFAGIHFVNQNQKSQILGLSKQQILHFATDKSGLAEIALYDVIGNRVVKMITSVSTGFNAVSLADYSLKNGVYIVRMKSGAAVVSKRVNLVR